MKKFFTTLLAASMMLVSVNAFAQISVDAGYVNSTKTTEVSGNKSNKTSNGLYVGGSYNIPIVRGLGVAPGLTFEVLSAKDVSSLGGVLSASGTETEMYLGVPVMFNYGLQLADDLKLVLFAGPTVQYGLSSKMKYEASIVGISGEKTFNQYDDESYKRMDVLLGGGVALEFLNMFQVKAGYNYGLLNRYDSSNISLHRSEINLGVAFVF